VQLSADLALTCCNLLCMLTHLYCLPPSPTHVDAGPLHFSTSAVHVQLPKQPNHRTAEIWTVHACSCSQTYLFNGCACTIPLYQQFHTNDARTIRYRP
jgi:hypothetical protein